MTATERIPYEEVTDLNKQHLYQMDVHSFYCWQSPKMLFLRTSFSCELFGARVPFFHGDITGKLNESPLPGKKKRSPPVSWRHGVTQEQLHLILFLQKQKSLGARLSDGFTDSFILHHILFKPSQQTMLSVHPLGNSKEPFILVIIIRPQVFNKLDAGY